MDVIFIYAIISMQLLAHALASIILLVYRDDFECASSQWETTLQCNIVCNVTSFLIHKIITGFKRRRTDDIDLVGFAF